MIISELNNEKKKNILKEFYEKKEGEKECNTQEKIWEKH